MQLLRYSKPFKFDTEPIEYCLILFNRKQNIINCIIIMCYTKLNKKIIKCKWNFANQKNI